MTSPKPDVARKILWAVQRPDGHVVTRTLSMVGDGHPWSEQEARDFVASPAFADWTVLRQEQVTAWTPWEPVSRPEQGAS